MLVPLAVPLVVYGIAYSVPMLAGLAHWNPGGGKWTSISQVASNVIIKVSLLAVIGTVTALGEEIVIAGVAFYASMRRGGLAWRALAQRRSQRSSVASAV